MEETTDASALTHVAAILVGVVVTLGIVSALTPSKEEIPAAAPEKSVGAAKTASPAKPPSTEEPSKPPTKKKKTKKAKSAAPPAEDEPAVETKSSKKKKKKSKNSNSNNNKNNSNGNNNNNNTKENDTNNTSQPEPEKSTPPPQQQQQQQQWQPPQDDDDGWGVVVDKRKKKGNKPKAAPISAGAPAPTAADTVMIDAKKVGIIIGPKGATMKAIEEATGCKLDVNAPARDAPVPANLPNKTQKASVKLSGTTEAIQKARTAIQELERKGYASILQSDNFGEFSISVHPRCLSEIVGPGGKVIQALQTNCDVKISIPPTDWKPNTPPGMVQMCKVGIAGSKENSRTAKGVLQSLVEFHHHELTHPGMIHETVYVPNEFFHCVIGSKGSEMKHIRGNYKVDVYMPNNDSKTQDVLVVGKKSNVDRAITHITNLMDRDSEIKEKKYDDSFY